MSLKTLNVFHICCNERKWDGAAMRDGAENFTKVIIDVLLESGELTRDQLRRKWVCFGADGASISKGAGLESPSNFKINTPLTSL